MLFPFTAGSESGRINAFPGSFERGCRHHSARQYRNTRWYRQGGCVPGFPRQQLHHTNEIRWPYQPACSVAASATDLPSLPVCHLLATKRRPVIPSACRDTSQSNGGTMIEGSSSADFAISGTVCGTMPVSVGPPGSSAFTVTPGPSRSCAQMIVSDSNAAFE